MYHNNPYDLKLASILFGIFVLTRPPMDPSCASEGDRSKNLCIMWLLADVLDAMLIVHMSVVDHGSMLLDDDKQAIPFVLFFPIAS